MEDITETLKKEFSEIKLHIKPQVVQVTEVRVIDWLMYFYPDMHLKSLE